MLKDDKCTKKRSAHVAGLMRAVKGANVVAVETMENKKGNSAEKAVKELNEEAVEGDASDGFEVHEGEDTGSHDEEGKFLRAV